MEVVSEKNLMIDLSQRDEKFITNSPEETVRVASELARSLEPGGVVALFGELGSGKTTFIAGVCRGLGVLSDITSPTFTLIHEYCGRLPVYHFDFYRIDDPHEIWQLGWEEYFYGEGICLIEWADHILDYLPQKRIEIYLKNFFQQGLENQREIRIRRL